MVDVYVYVSAMCMYVDTRWCVRVFIVIKMCVANSSRLPR